MFENERALRKMSSGDVIDYSIEVYKRNFKSVTILSLIFYVPFSFLYSMLSGFFSNELLRLGDTQRIGLDVSAAYILTSIGIGILYLVYIVTINAVMGAAVSKIIYDDIVYQRSRKLKTVIKESFMKFSSLLGYKIILYLILIGVFIGAAILAVIGFFIYLMFVGLFGIISINSGGIAGFGALYVISIVILAAICFSVIVFVAFFYVKFGFGVQVIAVENRRAAEGISRSIELSNTNFWNSFWALFFGLILYYFIPGILLGIVRMLSFDDAQLYNGIYFVASTAIQIIQSIFYPFIVTLITVIFINMKIKNEGLDLEVKVDKLLGMEKTAESGEKTDG